jgi:hypothetical protein
MVGQDGLDPVPFVIIEGIVRSALGGFRRAC